ncbi:hypothetical protein X975_12123, partial [Stegodyphus mimosarum]
MSVDFSVVITVSWTTSRRVYQCRLPDSLRWRAIERMEIGMSQVNAARHLNVSRSVIHRLWNQFESEGSVSRRHAPGRPRVITPTGDVI